MWCLRTGNGRQASDPSMSLVSVARYTILRTSCMPGRPLLALWLLWTEQISR